MDTTELYKIFKKHPIISTDTRNCIKDSIFFALKGANFNGNSFATKALEQGCTYAIVDEPEYATHPNIIVVDDCLTSLQQLAAHHRRQFKIPVVGITGTNGKTTTKELTTSILSQIYNVLATDGNLNNHIGVPLTLLRIKKEHEIAVIEMGANHVGEIKQLAEIADPNYGIITSIGHAHIEGFGSFENIVKTKYELFDYIKHRKDGKIFVDYDNQLLKDLSEGITTLFYGHQSDLFVSGKVLRASPFLEFEWRFSKVPHEVKTKLIGQYNLTNALAAISVGKYFGVKSDLVVKALEEYTPKNNRSQLKETDRNTLFIDAYNANPTSMEAALENFTQMSVDKKVLILGDMKELGANTDIEHQKVADYVAKHHFSDVMLVGEHFCKVATKYLTFKDTSELNEYLSQNPIRDSFILLKGSRGMQLEKCIDLL